MIGNTNRYAPDRFLFCNYAAVVAAELGGGRL
jgi:hypothetical protein